MKVLFIGGTGNISSAITELAIAQGMDLFLLHRNSTPPLHPGIQTIIGDAHDRDLLSSIAKEHFFDCVVNWVAYDVDHIIQDIEIFRDRVKQYIFISSASAYQKIPSQENISEKTPLENPYWEYSRKKIACEKSLLKAFHQMNFPATIVRPSHTYNTKVPLPVTSGYTGIYRLIKEKTFVIHDEGKSLWTLTHAQDFAKGFIGLMGRPETTGEAYHITSDEALTWNEIVQITAEALGVEPNIFHIPSETIAKFIPSVGPGLLGDKKWSLCFDNSKIKNIVPEYKATISFREGIIQTIDLYKKNLDYQIINHSLNAQVDHLIESCCF